MLLFKLAVLNMTRNRRRSIITILAVGVGLTALIFLWAFMDGSQEEQRDNVIRLLTGHLQIHAKGFERSLAAELVIPNHRELIQKLASERELKGIAERVKCEALIGTSEQSRGVVLMGIDLAHESEVTDVAKYVREGAFLSEGENRQILIGHRLADRIGVGVGDKVVVMTQAIDGSLTGFAYRVKGILRSGSLALDELTVFVTLASARELLDIGDATHEIAVRLTSRAAIPSFVAELKGFLEAEAYEISTWDDIVPEVNQWANYSEAIIRTMLVAVMAVIAVGIMNTVLMSIFERTRELGVMMAIGTSPAQIVQLVLLETFVLGVCGILLGLATGYLLAIHFGQVGIPLRGFEEAFAESFMSPIVHPQLKFHRVIECVGTLVVITSLIGLYPAWKAGRIEPVKAIYHS